MDEEEIFFCRIYGKQLHTINEIGLKICNDCRTAKENVAESEYFFCWACGRRLFEKGEVAQGVCHNRKVSINRKIGIPPLKH